MNNNNPTLSVDIEELANGYLFSAFKCEEDYPETPYFSQIFYDHTEMKVFSSNHSYKEKDKYPKYVSMYWKVETNKASLLDIDREVVDWEEAFLKYSNEHPLDLDFVRYGFIPLRQYLEERFTLTPKNK
jgi:hypothetical protein